MKIVINRCQPSDKQILGELVVLSGFSTLLKLKTLELPWKDNQRNISCIPKGTYKAILHRSPRFGLCLWIQDVEGRSEILIHRGNFYTDIKGCVLVGYDHQDINNDGLKDVTSSRNAMRDLLRAIGDKKSIKVVIK